MELRFWGSEWIRDDTYPPSYNTSQSFSSSFNVSWSSCGSRFLAGGIEKSGRVLLALSTGTPSFSSELLLSLAMTRIRIAN
jgi:hypothetical protein